MGHHAETIQVITRTHTMAYSGSHLCQSGQGARRVLGLRPILAHLEEKVGDALVATAGSQHEWSLPFWGRHVHTHSRLEEQVHDGVMSNVGGVHQRGPATTILLIQIELSPKQTQQVLGTPGHTGGACLTCQSSIEARGSADCQQCQGRETLTWSPDDLPPTHQSAV